jgi:hypothetical protein
LSREFPQVLGQLVDRVRTQTGTGRFDQVRLEKLVEALSKERDHSFPRCVEQTGLGRDRKCRLRIDRSELSFGLLERGATRVELLEHLPDPLERRRRFAERQVARLYGFVEFLPRQVNLESGQLFVRLLENALEVRDRAAT